MHPASETSVFTVRDGRIESVREYMDTLYAHRVAFGDTARMSQSRGLLRRYQ